MFRFDSNLSCDSFPREEIFGLLYIVRRLNSTDILRLQLAQVPRTPNLVTFCVHEYSNNYDDDRTDCFTPCSCVWGSKHV